MWKLRYRSGYSLVVIVVAAAHTSSLIPLIAYYKNSFILPSISFFFFDTYNCAYDIFCHLLMLHHYHNPTYQAESTSSIINDERDLSPPRMVKAVAISFWGGNCASCLMIESCLPNNQLFLMFRE